MFDKDLIKEMTTRIEAIQKLASELKEMGDSYEAVRKNSDRILACVKVLEINVSDVLELL